MGRSYFLTGFLVVALLFLSFSHGFGRVLTENSENKTQYASVEFEESEGKSREMMELDYEEAGPNTNTRSGALPPPSQSQLAPAPLA